MNLNPVLKEILETRRVTSTQGEIFQLHSSIGFEEGVFLQKIMMKVNAVASLEIGLAYGVSALFICDALQKSVNTRHTVIDPNQFGGPWGTDWKGIGLENLKRAGYEEIVEFHNAPSHIVLPKLETNGLKIDFAFIDGFHTFDYALMDFFYIDRMLRVGGAIAFDDTKYPSIRKLCRYIITNRSYCIFGSHVPAIHNESRLTPIRHYRLEGKISRFIRRVIDPEYVAPDGKLGLVPGSTCIAFQKISDDTRHWFFHHEF